MRASSRLKGSDFFRRKRTTASASSRLEGRVSKSSSTTRTTVSGRMAITSRERPAMPPKALSMACRTADPSRRLGSTRSGTRVPGASSLVEQTSTMRPASADRPASTRSAAISQARGGRAACFEVVVIAELKSPRLRRWAQESECDLPAGHRDEIRLPPESESALLPWCGRS